MEDHLVEQDEIIMRKLRKKKIKHVFFWCIFFGVITTVLILIILNPLGIKLTHLNYDNSIIIPLIIHKYQIPPLSDKFTKDDNFDYDGTMETDSAIITYDG